MKQFVKRAVAPFRPHLRPSFLIVGAQKAGTSALFDTLAQHPGLLAPEVKELDFFSRNAEFERGLAHYLGQFPLRPWERDGRSTFEASPSYLDAPEAPARIRSLFPGMRIIIILRDPVKRVFSAWNMYRQFKGHPKYAHRFDPRGFEQAMREALDGLPNSGPIDDYLERGHYAPRVRRYQEVFGREPVLILSYRDYKADPKGTLDKVCDHVMIERFEADHPAFTTRSNERPYDRSMPEEMKAELYRYYAPHMADLHALLGPAADICEEPAFRHLWIGTGLSAPNVP